MNSILVTSSSFSYTLLLGSIFFLLSLVMKEETIFFVGNKFADFCEFMQGVSLDQSVENAQLTLSKYYKVAGRKEFPLKGTGNMVNLGRGFQTWQNNPQ